jgi:hypothetical protein
VPVGTLEIRITTVIFGRLLERFKGNCTSSARGQAGLGILLNSKSGPTAVRSQIQETTNTQLAFRQEHRQCIPQSPSIYFHSRPLFRLHRRVILFLAFRYHFPKSTMARKRLPAYHQHKLLYSQEDLLKYRQGGYHPVHLGDLFKNGRYEIHHKLGWGGFATVWLANDKTYVMRAQKLIPSSTNVLKGQVDGLL